MQARIKRYLRHPVLHNAAALYSVQIAEYVLPMITVPYLARVLQPAGWGLVVYAQNFSGWLVLVLEYGFGFSATREIARQRDKSELHGEVAAGVLGANFLLLLPALIVALAAAFVVPVFREHPIYLWLALAIAVPQGMKPFWYFQGVEKMQFPAWINVGGRFLAAIGIFWLVTSKQHGWIVLALQAVVGSVVSLVIAIGMYRRISFCRPTLEKSLEALKSGWSIFMSRSAASLYTMANTLILGFFVASDAVAYYGGAERVVLAVFGLMMPLFQALYPRMSHLAATNRGRAASAIKYSLVLFGSIGLILGIVLIAAAPLIVRLLLGPSYKPAIGIMRVASISMPFGAISNILGIQWMLPFGMDREFNRIAISAGILNVILAVSLSAWFGAMGTAWAVVVSQAFITTSMGTLLVRSERRERAQLAAQNALAN